MFLGVGWHWLVVRARRPPGLGRWPGWCRSVWSLMRAAPGSLAGEVLMAADVAKRAAPRQMAGRLADPAWGTEGGRPASGLLSSRALIPTLIDRQGADRHGQRPDQPGTWCF